MAIGSGMLIGSLASCASALPVYKTEMADNQVTVPVSLFANAGFQVIQPKGMYYNIGLKKENDGSFTALLLRCTHADNQLTAAGNGFKCTLHGSTFDNDGRVTKGPAERPLKRYPTQVISGQVVIHLT
jgi:Rieske Fe-S protein